MALFGAKKQEKKQDEPKGPIVGFTKSKRFLFFKMKAKPIYDAKGAGASQPLPPPPPQPESVQTDRTPRADQKSHSFSFPKFGSLSRLRPGMQQAQEKTPSEPDRQRGAQGFSTQRPNQLQMFWVSTASKHKDLEAALRAQNIKESPYEFVRKMFIYAVIVAAVIGILSCLLLASLGVSPILGVLLGVACYSALFNKFIKYPLDRSVVVGKDIEKDILFAARDLVISMRSGVPLFNAITAVSTGYGAASLEFAKVVELIQLGTPIEQALDEVSAKSQSRTFKRIMLQATVSLKAGADIVGALQGVVDEVMQERIIELRRYGQRLNALAMFYMLFGVIFPSMGIAVAAILTTFISLFTVDQNTLLFGAIGIFFLQIIFLNIMRSSRPTFAM
jgi:flagellar protein FlaJ